MTKIKIVFMGTPVFAKVILEGLIKEYNVCLVVSQPDKEKDKKGNLIETPTKILAKENEIDIYQPIKIKDDYQKVLDCKPDLIVTCAYGQIIPKEILDFPKYGCINVHGSLLPKLRGGAPIHRALINGDKKTGITIMYMSEKMDAGDIISQKEYHINDEDNLDTLYNKLAIVGRELLLCTIPSIINGTNSRIKQEEEQVTFGYNIRKEEEKINFNCNAITIQNLIRGLSSVPGAYCLIDDKRLKIYNSIVITKKSTGSCGQIVDITKEYIIVNCKDYQIGLLDIKLEGKNRCKIKEFINGIKKEDYIGKILK